VLYLTERWNEIEAVSASVSTGEDRHVQAASGCSDVLRHCGRKVA
jgi:hypothetical protein